MDDRKYKVGADSEFILTGSEINKIIGANLPQEEDFFINGVTTPDCPRENKVCFLEKASSDSLNLEYLLKLRCNLVITDFELGEGNLNTVISKNPRETFALIVARLFRYFEDYWNDYLTLDEAKACFPDSSLMNNVSVHKTSHIGNNCMLFPGVVIGPNVKLGNNVIVKPNSVIGFPGFGQHKDAKKNNQHLPHVGGVIIGNSVEIGSLSTICAGTIHPTVIKDCVFIDDHVHVSHNCVIQENVQVAAHAELSGSVVVEKDVWVSPNVSVVNGVVIGQNAFVGIGSCVTKPVLRDTNVAGNPARKLLKKNNS